MNPDLDALFSRRSIRQFENRPVPSGLVRDVLEAATAAPSAAGKDPWHFIVVESQAVRQKMADAMPYGKMLATAPIGIVVCGDMERVHAGELSYLLQDCSAAIENALLAANMLGLGACWLGIHPRADRIEFMRTLFELPQTIIPVSAIALGFAAEKKEARTRFRQEAVRVIAADKISPRFRGAS